MGTSNEEEMNKIDILYYATGFTIIISFLAVVTAVIWLPIPESNRELFIHMIGIVEGSFVTGLVGYFFVKSKEHKEP